MTYVHVSVGITVGVENREHVPIVGLCELSDSWILTGQKLIDQISDGRVGYPLASMNSTFDENSFVACGE